MIRLACCIFTVLVLAGCGKKDSADSPPGAPSEATPNAAAPNVAPGAPNAGAPAPGPETAMVDPATGQPIKPPPPGTGGPIQAGSRVWLHYLLKADGKVQMDTHGQPPQTYVQGAGQMLRGLELALDGMKPGEKKTVTLKPEEAFGPRNAEATQKIPRANIPNADSLQVGQVLAGRGPGGQQLRAVVQEIGPSEVVLDMNHPLAGKTVTFDVEIISVQ